MTIINVEETVAKWFDDGTGGRVQLRTLPISEFKEIQKKTTRKSVEYKKVEGTPARFETEKVDTDLQNELYWDAVIMDLEGWTDPKGKPYKNTKADKILLMNRSKQFLEFVVESLKRLGEDEVAQEEEEEKN